MRVSLVNASTRRVTFQAPGPRAGLHIQGATRIQQRHTRLAFVITRAHRVLILLGARRAEARPLTRVRFLAALVGLALAVIVAPLTLGDVCL